MASALRWQLKFTTIFMDKPASNINLALKLTVFRVVLIPVFLLVYFMDFLGSNWVALGIFSVASATDFFDGYVARRYQQLSQLGALLDPVADKLLIVVVLIALIARHAEGFEGIFMMLCGIVIIGREIVISALREFMAGLGIRSAVAVKYLGKVKTTVQIFALGFLIVYDKIWFIPSREIGWGLLFLAAVLAVWSMVDYLQSARRAIDKEDIDVYR